jgi:hypothetical protein
MVNVGSLRHCLCDFGIWNIAAASARYAKVREVDAQSSQNPLDLVNLFLQRWMHFCPDCIFEMADF